MAGDMWIATGLTAEQIRESYAFTRNEIEASRFEIDQALTVGQIRRWFADRQREVQIEIGDPLRVSFVISCNDAGVLESFCSWANGKRSAGVILIVTMLNTYTGVTTVETLGT